MQFNAISTYRISFLSCLIASFSSLTSATEVVDRDIKVTYNGRGVKFFSLDLQNDANPTAIISMNSDSNGVARVSVDPSANYSTYFVCGDIRFIFDRMSFPTNPVTVSLDRSTKATLLSSQAKALHLVGQSQGVTHYSIDPVRPEGFEKPVTNNLLNTEHEFSLKVVENNQDLSNYLVQFEAKDQSRVRAKTPDLGGSSVLTKLVPGKKYKVYVETYNTSYAINEFTYDGSTNVKFHLFSVPTDQDFKRMMQADGDRPPVNADPPAPKP